MSHCIHCGKGTYWKDQGNYVCLDCWMRIFPRKDAVNQLRVEGTKETKDEAQAAGDE